MGLGLSLTLCPAVKDFFTPIWLSCPVYDVLCLVVLYPVPSLVDVTGMPFFSGGNVSWGRGEVLEELRGEEGRKAVVEMYCVRENK